MKFRYIWIIVALGAVLRLATLPQAMVFTADESYLAYIAQTIIADFHIIWIGWSALGFDLYLGPFWIYIISPFLSFSQGDPLILGYLSSFLGLLTIVSIYILAKEMFNRKTAIIASILYASLPLIVFYDQKPYPPAIPLLSVVLTYCLFKTKTDSRWWIVFAAIYGFVFSIHLSLLPIIFVAIWVAWKQKNKLSRKVFVSSFVVFLLAVSPLIAFDYFHKGSNITAPIRALQMSTKTKGTEFSEHFNALISSLGRVIYLTPDRENSDEILPICLKTPSASSTRPPIIFSLFSVTILLFSLLRGNKLLSAMSLSYLIPFVFIPVINPVEYYLLGFFPLFFIMVGSFVSNLKHKEQRVGFVLIGLVIALGVNTVFTSRYSFGLEAKKRLVEKTMSAINHESYFLSATGECQDVGGWRYLFKVYGNKPTKSTDDAIFGWLFPNELSLEEPKYSVTVYETRVWNEQGQESFAVVEEGGFKAVITRK